MLKRELYIPSLDENRALWLVGCGYTNGGFSRIETITSSARADRYEDHKYRTSTDNGNSWTEFQPINMIFESENGGMVKFPGNYYFDSTQGILYHPVMRRIWHNVPFYTMPWDSDNKHPFYDHAFVIENESAEKMMKYEPGADWSINNSCNPDFLQRNMSYLGNSVAFGKDGAAFFPIVCSAFDEWKNFIIVMIRDPHTGIWSPSQPFRTGIGLPDCRLAEPDIALLKDGRILIICRGEGGRKWYSVSSDGGKTFDALCELKYDDGSRFFSPASIHRLIRSSKNGRLYWLANIVDKPPQGGRPRYPLYIGEIDEGGTGVRKESLLVVDDRRDNEPELLQLSNFQVIENRETLNIEIYMTRLGESPVNPFRAGVYKYIFTPQDA